MRTFISKVDGFKGECAPIFLPNGIMQARIFGLTGYFKLVKKGWLGIKYKSGKEFHGYVASDGKTIYTTEGIYSTSQMK